MNTYVIQCEYGPCAWHCKNYTVLAHNETHALIEAENMAIMDRIHSPMFQILSVT